MSASVGAMIPSSLYISEGEASRPEPPWAHPGSVHVAFGSESAPDDRLFTVVKITWRARPPGNAALSDIASRLRLDPGQLQEPFFDGLDPQQLSDVFAELRPFFPRPASLEATYDDEDRLVSAKLHHAEGLQPATLNRFPWARWLTVADQALRERAQGGAIGRLTPQLDSVVGAAMNGTRGRPGNVEQKRPGRKGHPADFYRQVAETYQALRREGVTNPTLKLAESAKVSRPTAAGWVKGARKRGYLPPARGNRPG